MIILDVKDFCHHGCNRFDPIVELERVEEGRIVNGEYVEASYNSYISCKMGDRCESIMQYLESRVQTCKRRIKNG